jgi:hypothetical protein
LIQIDKRGTLRNIELFEESSFFHSLPPDRAYEPIVDCRTVLSATENEKPQPGLTPDWGFPRYAITPTPRGGDGLSGDQFPY